LYRKGNRQFIEFLIRFFNGLLYTDYEERKLIGGESNPEIFLTLQRLVKEIRKYQVYQKIGYAFFPLVFGYFIFPWGKATQFIAWKGDDIPNCLKDNF
jgi:hypothetical protein